MPRGAGPDVDTVLLTLFTAAPSHSLTNGSWGWSLPFTPPPTPLSTSMPRQKNRLDFLKTSYLFCCKTAARLSSSLLHRFSAKKQTKKRLFSTPTMAAIPGLGYLSIYFIYIQCWYSNSARPSIYLPDSLKNQETVLIEHLHNKVRKKSSISEHSSDSRRECFSLLGCQRQPCEQRAGGLKTDSLAAEDFTRPGFLNFSHPLWFPPFRIPIYPQPWRKKAAGMRKFYKT